VRKLLQECSPIEHLGRAIWLNRYAKGNVFAMLASYFDASYDNPKTVTVVSGWIGTVYGWERFDTDWKILLAQYDLPYFHMKEFAHSVGPFKTWKEEENKRAVFLAKAVDVIGTCALYGLACIVEHAAFDKVSKSLPLAQIGGVPFSLAGRDCIAHANVWLNQSQRGLPVKYIFENGDQGKGELMRIMNRDCLPTPIFAPSVDTSNGDIGLTPLQAADFAAWEVLKTYRSGENLPLYKYRRSIMELARIPGWWGRYAEKDLVALCRKAMATKPSSK
jgi:hypothetical protein